MKIEKRLTIFKTDTMKGTSAKTGNQFEMFTVHYLEPLGESQLLSNRGAHSYSAVGSDNYTSNVDEAAFNQAKNLLLGNETAQCTCIFETRRDGNGQSVNMIVSVQPAKPAVTSARG